MPTAASEHSPQRPQQPGHSHSPQLLPAHPTPGSAIASRSASSLWLVRPRSDGGSDYVSFVPSQGQIEIREGSHLPPQMPLLKRRRCIGTAEAEACRRSLQLEAGFRHSEPLF